VKAFQRAHERLEQTCDALFHARGRGAFALTLGRDHSHDLTATGDQVAEKTSVFILQWPDLRLCGDEEIRNHGRVDDVGFGPLA
jgi:hypothetical protein